MKKTLVLGLVLCLLLSLAGCSKSDATYSNLADKETMNEVSADLPTRPRG